MGVIGLFCSTYHPASNTLISHAIREKGRGFGIHGIAGSLGTAVIPALSAWIGAILGWKVPYILFGFMGIGTGFYSLTISRESVIARGETRTKEPEIGLTRKVYLNLIFFYLSAVGLGLSYRGIMTFLPVYLGQNVHMSFLKIDTVALGGTLAAVALLSGAAGQYLSGRLVDYLKPEALYLGAVGLLTVMVFLMARASDLLLVITAILYAFLYFSTQPIQNYLISGYLPRHRQGRGFGIHFFLVEWDLPLQPSPVTWQIVSGWHMSFTWARYALSYQPFWSSPFF
jgi:MFS family permease